MSVLLRGGRRDPFWLEEPLEGSFENPLDKLPGGVPMGGVGVDVDIIAGKGWHDDAS